MAAMTCALTNEPNKKAKRLAMAIRGVKPKTKLKAFCPCQKGAAGKMMAMVDKAIKAMLTINAKTIIKRA